MLCWRGEIVRLREASVSRGCSLLVFVVAHVLFKICQFSIYVKGITCSGSQRLSGLFQRVSCWCLLRQGYMCKEGLKEKKNVLEHHPTVERPQRGTPGWWATVWFTSINFYHEILILKQHQIFKISYFHKFHLSSQNIPQNHQKTYKKPET